MNTHIPTLFDIRGELVKLTIRQLDDLGAISGVPATTIYKIRLGITQNPGIETVRAFLPHIKTALKS